MTAITTQHPTAAQLTAFSLGTLSDDESAYVEAHLEDCETCLAAVADEPTDGLVSVFQSAVHSDVPHPIEALLGNNDTQPQPVGPAAYDFLSPPLSDDELGRLGSYRLLKLIGTGGMGLVFLAEDVRLRRKVALKVLKPIWAADAGFRRRFLDEARAAAAVEHDHIVAVYQVGDENGVPFLSMPLLQGETLATRLKREGRVPVREAARIARETALGLAAAHDRGLIHSDIKPGNLWLETRAGAKSRVKIVDFGLARVVADEGIVAVNGVVAGTPAYMSPEQCNGEPVDARSDLFSLGCVMFEMLAGRLPFNGTSLKERQAKLAVPAPPLHDAAPQTPTRIARLVDRLLSKNASDRPKSASEVAGLLTDVATHKRLRHRLTAAAALLMIAILVVGLSMWHQTPVKEFVVNTTVPAEPPATMIGPFAEIQRYVGHTNRWVECATLSPDGRRILSCGHDATVRLWDRSTGKELRTFTGHTGPVKRVAFLPDGRRAISCSDDRSLRLWDLEADEPPRIFTGHTGAIEDVVVSPDGRQALSTSNGSTMRLWDIATAAVLQVMRGHDGPVVKAAFSPDGRLIISGGHDGTVRLWDVATATEQRCYRGHEGRVWCVAFSKDGKRAVSGSADRTVRVWDIDSDRQIACCRGSEDWIRSVAFTPDGRHVWSGNHQSAVSKWDLESEQESIRLPVSTGAVSLQLSPDGRQLLVASNDGMIRLWGLPDASVPVLPFAADDARRLQESWAEKAKVPVSITNSVGMKMNLIPPGLFKFGEKCQAYISKPYYLACHEVTVKQFREFIAETNYQTDAESSPEGGVVKVADGTRREREYTWKHPDCAFDDNAPVGQLSWNDATHYCEWLSKKENKLYRLPTEAEWEWACRAGTIHVRHFAPDQALDEYLWSISNSQGRSHPVGQLRPNAWGLFDMYGNICEYCQDWLADHPNLTVIDYAGPAAGQRRVIRGGGYPDDALDSSVRAYNFPDKSMGHFGFRVCREP